MQQLLYQNSGGKRLRWIVFTEERIVRYIVSTSAGNDRSSPISDFNSTAQGLRVYKEVWRGIRDGFKDD